MRKMTMAAVWDIVKVNDEEREGGGLLLIVL